MRLKLQADWNFKPNESQLNALRRYDPSVEVYPPDYEHEWSRGTLKGSFLADPSDLQNDPDLRGVPFRFDGGSAEMGGLLAVLQDLQQAMHRLAGVAPLRPERAPNMYNERCSVHVPGLGLLLINELQLMEDACTDAVQIALDSGWRIVAVAPQPDQRRPDYILGRTKP